jgi:hypothetical protein
MVLDVLKNMTKEGQTILLEELEKNNPALHQEVQEARTINLSDILPEVAKDMMNDRVKELNGLLEAKKGFDKLGYFKDRWNDERQYEDFKEYIKAIENLFQDAAPAAKVTKVTKGFKIYVTYKGVHVYYTVSTKSISVKCEVK